MSHLCITDDCDTEAYGIAISQCDEDQDGRFWVSNGEYSNVVAFCPFCGTPAPNQELVSKTWEKRREELDAKAERDRQEHLQSDSHKNRQCICLIPPTGYVQVAPAYDRKTFQAAIAILTAGAK